MKHSVRLATAFVLLSTLPVAVVTLVSTMNAERTIERELEGHLLTISELRSADLQRWVESATQLIESIAQRPLVIDLVDNLAAQRRGEVSPQPDLESRLVSVHLLPHVEASGFFAELTVLDRPTGDVVASTASGRDDERFEMDPALLDAGTGTSIGQPRGLDAEAGLGMRIATPIATASGEVVALLAGDLRLDSLLEIISRPHDAHETGAVYLVDAEGRVAIGSPSEGATGGALPAMNAGGERATRGEIGTDIYRNHRGVVVLGAYQWIPSLSIGILAEIDRAEALSLIAQTRWVSYGLLTGAVAVFALLSVSIARQMSLPLRRIAAGAAKVGRGEFDHRIGSTRSDELGDLARAFDRMTESLQRITASRDDLQKEISRRREAEERFRRILDNAPDVIYRYRVFPEPAFEYVSAAVESVVGYRPEELLNDSSLAEHLVYAEDQGPFHDRTSRLPGDTPHPHRWTHREGHVVWVEDIHVPIFDGEDRLIAFEGVARDISERIETEHALRTADAIVQSLPTGLLILRADSGRGFVVERANPSAAKVIRGRPESLDGRSLKEIFPGQLVPELSAILRRAMGGDMVVDEQVTLREGEEIQFAVHLRSFLIAEDRLVVAIEDITPQTRAEEALQRSESQYRELVEEIHDVIYTIDADGCIAYVSPSITRLLGYSQDELIGRSYLSLGFADEFPSIETLCAAFEQSPQLQPREIRLIDRAGEVHWVRTTGRRILRAGRFAGFRGVLLDVTAARRSEEALRISEEQHRSLFENAALGIYQTTPDGRILAANPALLRMLGYERLEELQQRNLEDEAFYEPERPRAEFRRVLEEQGRFDGHEMVWTRQDGTRLFVRETAVAVQDDEGNTLFYEGMVEDITAQQEAEAERQRLEASLRQSQKLESIGTLASGVAHEINNPLTGMINYAELISRRVPDERLKAYAGAIMSEGARVAKIVRNLLSFARQERETFEKTDLSEILDASLMLVAELLRKDHVILHLDIPSSIPRIECRSHQIQQVLLNLLTNARDALNERFPREHPDKKLSVTVREITRKDGTWVRVTVEDSGAGIPEGHHERVFDPFFTTKPRHQGTGLGLSVSYGIVREHGGRLSFESRAGQPTQFRLDLPISDRLNETPTNESEA